MTSTTKSFQPNLSVWYKKLSIYFWGSLFTILCASCDQNSIIGRGIINKTEANIIESDTFTVEASTVWTDSVRTDRLTSDYMLVGQYTDPIFGKITATSFMRMVPGINPVKIPDDASVTTQTIDSLVLVLGVQKFQNDPIYVYPDKNVTQTIHIHRVNEEITNGIEYYSFNTRGYDAVPLATIQVNAAKLKEDKFIRVNFTQLAPAFSTEIINLIKAGTATPDDFQTVFRGFALVPDANSNGNIIGFANNISTALVVHYTKSTVQQGGAIPPQNVPSVTNIFPGVSFHGIKANRTGTPLANITTAWQPLLAKNMNGNAYMQAGIGIYTRLTFPTLKELKKLGNVVINKAILTIKPTLGTLQGYATPESIFFYESGADYRFAYQTINGNRQIVRATIDGVSSSNAFVQYNARDEQYDVYLSRHCQYLMSGDKTNQGLIMVSGNNSFTVNRSVLSNVSTATPNKIRLRVFYTLFK